MSKKAELSTLLDDINDVVKATLSARDEISSRGAHTESISAHLKEIVKKVHDLEKKIPGCRPALLEAERLTDEILDVILSLAALDFTKTVRVGYEDSNFDAVAAGLNMLGEELQRSTVSKAYVDNIISSMNDALIVINSDKTLKTVNDFARALLGYEERELDGRDAHILFDHEPLFLQGKNIELPKGSGDGQADVVFRTKDNRHIPMQIKGSLMYDPAGDPAGLVIVARDMREIYRLIANAEQSANAERERSEELLDAQKVIEAANQDLSAVNASLEKEILHRKRAEERLQQAHDNLEMLVQERTAALSKAVKLLNIEVEERKKAEEETRAREKKYRDIFENTTVSVWEADVSESIKILKKIPAKDHNDLLKLISQDPEKASLAVGKIRVIDVNSAAALLFEAEAKNQLIEEYSKTFQQSAFQKITESLCGFAFGHEVFEAEAEFVTLQGKKRVLHLLISLQHNEIDDHYSILLNFIDISQQRELEEQLRQSQKMEAIGRLAGGVAHDFNNLLTVILNYGQMLADEIPKEDHKNKQIQQIVECAERAGALTSQLLAFSRKQVVALKVVNLNESILKMDQMLRRLVGEDIELVNHLDESIASIKGDNSQIEQIILNLAVNARDAMPKGGKLIVETCNMDIDDGYVLAHPDIDPGSYVVVSITDTGAGMSDQTKSKIFEPFFTTKGLGKGTGLGLSTVYGNMKQVGGHIWVYSEVGIGTTFRLFFPKLKTETAQPEKEIVEEPSIEGCETILVVDDEDKVKDLATGILKERGYNVISASNAGEALLLSEQHKDKIDLLLSDVVMPNLNGPELAKRLLGMRSDMKVLYMSGYTDKAISENGSLPKGTRLVQKPFTKKLLASQVRQALDEKEDLTA